MTDRNKSAIAIIMDRSGSMEAIRKDMEGGLATFIADRKKDPTEVRVSLYQFDDQYEMVYEWLLVSDVPPMVLVPRNQTALLDAVGRTIHRMGDRLRAMPEHERPAAVVVMIISDGLENASREFSASQVAEMIQHQEKNYSWKFLYLGADAKAFQEAHAMGIASVRSAQFTPNAIGSHALYDSSSKGVAEYFANVSAGVIGADLTLNAEEGLIVNPDGSPMQPAPATAITTK